jgi:hypothetical protein
MTTLQASTYNYALSTVSTSTYTILSSDAGKLLFFTNNTNPVEVTFPASLAMNTGDTVEIVYTGTGTLDLIADTGVTLNSEGSLLSIGTRYGRVSVTKTAADIFLVSWMTAITEAEIAANAVTTTKIANDAVTSDKLGASLTLTGTTSFEQILEKAAVSNSSLSSTTNLDALSGAVYYNTSSTTSNITLNLRGDGSNTLDSLVTEGKAFSCVYMITSGSTSGKISSITIGSSTVSVKWFGANAYPAGSGGDNVDVYTITAVKTDDTGNGTFTVFASQSKFG